MTVYETTYFQDDMPFQSLYKGSKSAAVDAAEKFIIAIRSGQHGSPDGVSVRVEKLDESGELRFIPRRGRYFDGHSLVVSSSGVEEILHIDIDD